MEDIIAKGKCQNCYYWQPKRIPKNRDNFHTGKCSNEIVKASFPNMTSHNNFCCNQFKPINNNGSTQF